MAQQLADRVKETTTTSGTGAITLAGAMTGFQPFSAVCSVGDTCYYALQGVNTSGVPTGDWEVGLGAYSAASTLTRTTVLASSNGGAAVNLSGTHQVWMDYPAAAILALDPLPYILVRDQQSNGVNAGSSVAGVNTRNLNTVVANTIPGASLASSAITLPAGTYVIDASAPAFRAAAHQANLVNASGAILVAGTSEVAGNVTTGSQTRSHINGTFTLSATTTVSVAHYMYTAFSGVGLGSAAGSSISGAIEVYTTVQITKVG
jgi:hypothetical protein